jgi:hypothetical protein
MSVILASQLPLAFWIAQHMLLDVPSREGSPSYQLARTG